MPASRRSASSPVKSSTSTGFMFMALRPIFILRRLPPEDFFFTAAPPPASEIESGVWPSLRTAAIASERLPAWTVPSTRLPSLVTAL